ncbi:unnamed protein product [Coregonus sp. 'balchen']|nr:unnamed protein product [Coregonus sp. 'balchen']
MAYLEFKFEDQITKYIREQELETSLKFITLRKDKHFGQKDAQPLAQKKLSWESKSLPFNGVPFQVVGTKTYECHQGKDRQTKAKEKYAAERDKKEIEESTVRSKKEASQTLKAALSETPSSVKAEVVYCVRFPSLSEHSSHAVVGECMTDLSSRLKSVLLDMKANVPQDTGLPLTFSPRKRKAEKAMDPLPTKRASHPFTGGVEQHTEDIVSVDTLLALTLG